jgi:exodeoxyribonuclease-5
MAMMRADPYINALQVKYAYALTCHKSQGGQWSAVFVDMGYLRDDMLDLGFMRWLYTALTRATEQLFLVNFSQQFFVG